MAANVLKVALNVSVFHGENTRYLNYVYKSWVKLKEHKHSSTSTEKKTSTLYIMNCSAAQIDFTHIDLTFL